MLDTQYIKWYNIIIKEKFMNHFNENKFMRVLIFTPIQYNISRECVARWYKQEVITAEQNEKVSRGKFLSTRNHLINQ